MTNKPARQGFAVGDLVRRTKGAGETVWRVRSLGYEMWNGKYILIETNDAIRRRARSKPDLLAKVN